MSMLSKEFDLSGQFTCYWSKKVVSFFDQSQNLVAFLVLLTLSKRYQKCVIIQGGITQK